MLSHADKADYSDNVPMKPQHFESSFDFEFDNTNLVARYLIKDIDKNNLKLAGKLTKEGVDFIEEEVKIAKVITLKMYRTKIDIL